MFIALGFIEIVVYGWIGKTLLTKNNIKDYAQINSQDTNRFIVVFINRIENKRQWQLTDIQAHTPHQLHYNTNDNGQDFMGVLSPPQ